MQELLQELDLDDVACTEVLRRSAGPVDKQEGVPEVATGWWVSNGEQTLPSCTRGLSVGADVGWVSARVLNRSGVVRVRVV